MSVLRFSVPGHATSRDFAVYVVVAKRRNRPEIKLYVGKTGDNRDGCNPVISRAGNHFSYNDVHSQVRNKLGAPPPEFEFEYFYVSFGGYEPNATDRREKVDLINEMERRANFLLQERLPADPRMVLMNPHKNAAWVSHQVRKTRAALGSLADIALVEALARGALEYANGLLRDG
jgi:hypothetical protein